MKNAAISMRGFVIWKIFRIANGYLSVVEVRGVYGLPSEHWKAIYRIFYAQKTRLRWVKLFGSRARGLEAGAGARGGSVARYARKEEFVCAYIQRANGADDLCGCKGQVLCDAGDVRRRCCGAIEGHAGGFSMNLPNPIREGSGRAVIIAVYCVLCFLVRECAEKEGVRWGKS